MIWALLISATIVAAIGLTAKFVGPLFLDKEYWHIDWREFVAGLLVAYLAVTPLVFTVGDALSTSDALRYEEFYNGVETDATFSHRDCRPGTSGNSSSAGHSNCRYEYNTGQTYTWTEIYYVTVTKSDGNGGTTTSSEMRTRSVTDYIYNPYATKEYSYAIADSLGKGYSFPDVYVKDGEGYQGGELPADLPRGDPKEWLEAKERLAEGNPRPVTALFSYDNYILAANDEMLKPYSEDVEQYLEEGILPDHTADIGTDPLHGFNDLFADKVSFVGVEVSDEKAWQDSLMSFNAALGSKLRGDLHLVLIDTSLVNSPTDYLNALKAYWLSEDFGRRAIAKNAIIVVAGVNGDTVEWGMASTGMPFGNEVMLRGIMNFLPDTPLDPTQVIGTPHTVYPETDGDVRVTISDTPGVLERVVLKDFPFARACMDCVEEDGEIGYADLVAEIEPEPWQWAIMIVVIAILSSGWWFLAGNFELFNWLPGFRKSASNKEEPAYESYDLYKTSFKVKDRRRNPRRRDKYHF